MEKVDRRRVPERRDQILREAQRLFLAHGLEQVTTRQIAGAVGISQPSLYAHFPTRDAIAVELCCRAFSELSQTLAAVDMASEGHDRIRGLGRAYIEFGLRYPAAYRVAFMLNLSGHTDEDGKRALQAGIGAFKILREAYRSFEHDDDRAELAAQSGWSRLHGLVALLLARPEFPFVEHNRLVAQATEPVVLLD